MYKIKLAKIETESLLIFFKLKNSKHDVGITDRILSLNPDMHNTYWPTQTHCVMVYIYKYTRESNYQLSRTFVLGAQKLASHLSQTIKTEIMSIAA